jgi:hypothetical protein
MFWKKKEIESTSTRTEQIMKEYEIIQEATQKLYSMKSECIEVLKSRGLDSEFIVEVSNFSYGLGLSLTQSSTAMCMYSRSSASEFYDYICRFPDMYYNSIYTQQKHMKHGVRKKSIGYWDNSI